MTSCVIPSDINVKTDQKIKRGSLVLLDCVTVQWEKDACEVVDKSHLFYFVAIKRSDIYQTVCFSSLFFLVGLNSLVLTSQHDLYFLVCLALLLSRTILQIDVGKRDKKEGKVLSS